MQQKNTFQILQDNLFQFFLIHDPDDHDQIVNGEHEVMSNPCHGVFKENEKDRKDFQENYSYVFRLHR